MILSNFMIHIVLYLVCIHFNNDVFLELFGQLSLLTSKSRNHGIVFQETSHQESERR